MISQCPKCKEENPDDSVFCTKYGTQISESEKRPLPTQTIEAPKEELTSGSTFAGRYQIIEELGKGGMGKVYVAEDTKLARKVAIKVLPFEMAADPDRRERFKREAKAIAAWQRRMNRG